MSILHRIARKAAVVLLLATSTAASAQNGNIAINETGAAPHPMALLDISSISKGLLIPRTGTLPPAAALPDGLTMYRTGANGGFHVVDNGAWKSLESGRNNWDVYGNHLVGTPNPNFLGTTDGAQLNFRTFNAHRMHFSGSTGFLAVGHPAGTAPKERLDINGQLQVYYEPPSGRKPSDTDAPGVIRYQPFGVLSTGASPYRLGSLEEKEFSSAALASEVVGSVTALNPLFYAAHWGNVDGRAPRIGSKITTTPNTLIQPSRGGWRAFENPYKVVAGKAWTDVKNPICTPGSAAEIPSPPPPPLLSGNPIFENPLAGYNAPERDVLSPYWRSNWNILGAPWFPQYRRQYLYLASELNLELSQAANPLAVQGLCAHQPVTKVGFYVNNVGGYQRNTITGQSHIIVRNAPLGLDQLNGFDNTPPADPSTTGWGPLPANWPNIAVGANTWDMVTLTTPFIWDGKSPVIIEVVAALVADGPKNGPSAPVRVTGPAPNNMSYGAHHRMSSTSSYTPLPNPFPNPAWGPATLFSPSGLNKQLLFPNTGNGPTPGANAYNWGASTYRPIVRFEGTVASVPPGAAPTGTANFISYPGALILEDSTAAGRINSLSTDLPWGRMRPGFPNLYNYWNYAGNGTISAQKGIFDNGVRLNDHVFDRAFDGRVAPAEAGMFGRQRLLSVEEMAAFTQHNRHLPTMKGRTDWNRSGGFSLGDLTNQLWATAETHALYVADLHDQLNLLELLGNDRPLNLAEYRSACGQLANLPGYTDAQKARLIEAMRKRTPQANTRP